MNKSHLLELPLIKMVWAIFSYGYFYLVKLWIYMIIIFPFESINIQLSISLLSFRIYLYNRNSTSRPQVDWISTVKQCIFICLMSTNVHIKPMVKHWKSGNRHRNFRVAFCALSNYYCVYWRIFEIDMCRKAIEKRPPNRWLVGLWSSIRFSG